MIKKVLIIEKHDALRALIALITRPAYEVFKARDAVEAMAWIHLNQKPDIIIADAELADEHGENLLYTLRCSGVYGDIPVILLGEQADQATTQEKFLRQGAVAYFNLPFQPDALLAFLHQLAPAEQPANNVFPVRPLKVPNRVLAFDR
jgi:DNA-binding response OmpR family regulator